MPELPEVETTRKGIAPYVVGETIKKIVVRQPQLRWRVPEKLQKNLSGATIHKLSRRAKYLLFYTDNGCLIMHLGMSGSLRLLTTSVTATKHDHVDLIFTSGSILRFRDPRRFGCMLWTDADPDEHRLLQDLGPEPLGKHFNADYLYTLSRGRKTAIKNFIMNSHIVVGVGNIYANEILYLSGIHPLRAAGRISKNNYKKITSATRQVLGDALKKGGTTLRDFVDSNGNPGYFRHELKVYGRAELPCLKCRCPVKSIRQGQRSTYYCPNCQH